MQWAERLPTNKRDILVVAGDVSDRLDSFETTMKLLAQRFGLVFFVPGNHDLWVTRDGSEGDDSVDKLERLLHICERHGVLTTPQRVHVGAKRAGDAPAATVSICPLLSFHHSSFDNEPDVTALRLPSSRLVVTDYRATRWPAGLECGSEALAQYMDARNEETPRHSARQAATAPSHLHSGALQPLCSWDDAHVGTHGQPHYVISVSHFLPRIELIPEKRFLRYPDLIKAVGSHALGARVTALRPHLHFFGHTHFGWDHTLDGIRYVQCPLATPNEREYRPNTLSVGQPAEPPPMRLFDADTCDVCAHRPAVWSEHYRLNGRTPEEVFPAPWVLNYYRKRAPGRVRVSEEEEAAAARALPRGVQYAKGTRSTRSGAGGA